MHGKYLNKLQDKTVLIVGGTSGIGYGVAEASIEFGGHVIVASRSQSNVDQAVERLKASYPDSAARIRGHTVDLGAKDVEEQLKTLFDFATDNSAVTLNHIVHTAGDVGKAGASKLETITPDLLVEAGAVRLVGSVMLAKYANQYLDKSYTSSFTMTSGALVYRPSIGNSVMLAAIGGRDALTRALAKDMAPIRVNLVAPGAIDTDLLFRMAGGRSEAAAEMFSKMSLLGRIGDVADTTEVYMSAIKSNFMTGTVLHVEGGYLIN